MNNSPNKTLQRWIIVIIMFIMIVPIHLFSQNSNCCGGADSGFSLTAEYLYFQPFFDNQFEAVPNIDAEIPFNLNPGGPGRENVFEFSSGLRLGGKYSDFDCCDLISDVACRCTYLPATHNKRFGLLSFANGITDQNRLNVSDLHSHQTLDYFAGELFATILVFNDDSLTFQVQPGIHYAAMNFRHHSYFDVTESQAIRIALKEKSQSWGCGPQVCSVLNYTCYDWLSIKGEIKGGLLFSRAEAKANMTAGERDVLKLRPKTLNKIVPFWDVRLGSCLSFVMGGFPLEIEVGYEYLSYSDFIDRIQFPSVNPAHYVDNAFCRFDFQGPFFSLSLGF